MRLDADKLPEGNSKALPDLAGNTDKYKHG